MIRLGTVKRWVKTFLGIPLPPALKQHDQYAYPFTKPTYFESHVGASFLVLACGPTIETESEQVLRFIEQNRPIVIGCNRIPSIYRPDYHLFINRRRLASYVHEVHPEAKLLIGATIPEPIVRGLIGERPYQKVMFQSHHPGKHGFYRMQDGIIYTEGSTVALIGAGVALAMGARQIHMAGLDGYRHLGGDKHWYSESITKDTNKIMKRERIMGEVLDALVVHAQARSVDFGIITSTGYHKYYRGSSHAAEANI